MKYLKLFENFNQFDFTKVEDHLEMIQKMIPLNFEFGWKIELEDTSSDFQGFLFVWLYSLDSNQTLDWTIDVDSPSIKLVARGEDNFGDDISDLSYSQKLDSVDEAIDLIKSEIEKLILVTERKKSARYKGRKIPGKYLTGPHPGKMKKEIDKFVGKDVYKKDWDADYKSGKGGKGERVKTKKSPATKAYQKMFGDK